MWLARRDVDRGVAPGWPANRDRRRAGQAARGFLNTMDLRIRPDMNRLSFQRGLKYHLLRPLGSVV